jgi:uncharacterized domain HDIG
MPFDKPNGHLHKVLFENMIDGLAYCQIVYDGEKAVDWKYISVNPAFELQTGLNDVVNRQVSEVIPGIHKSSPRLLETYARVARTQRHERFEQYLPGLEMWFDISAYSFEQGTFVAVFQNITTQKKLIRELEKANKEILQVYDQTLQSWSRALEFRDKEIVGHSLRVVGLAEKLARAMNFRDRELIEFRRGALLHDVGKMAISDVILHKPGKLDAEEIELMQRHPQIAYDILFPIKFLEGCALEIPYCHHELWDGSGYPRGLKKYEIPQCARLFTVVDVFDAMTSDRPYRIALSKKFTLDYIRAKSGELYDPKVVDVFLKMMGSF